MAEDFESRRDAARRQNRDTLSSNPATKKVMNSSLDPNALILGRFPDKTDYKVYQSSTMRMLAAVKQAPPETSSGPTLSQLEVVQKLSALPPHLEHMRGENRARREALAGSGRKGASKGVTRHHGAHHAADVGDRARTEHDAAFFDSHSRGHGAFPRRDTL